MQLNQQEYQTNNKQQGPKFGNSTQNLNFGLYNFINKLINQIRESIVNDKEKLYISSIHTKYQRIRKAQNRI